MNAVDAMVLALLALADISLLVHLRRRRARIARVQHMYRTLTLAVRRELAVGTTVSPLSPRQRRAAAKSLLKRNLKRGTLTASARS